MRNRIQKLTLEQKERKIEMLQLKIEQLVKLRDSLDARVKEDYTPQLDKLIIALNREQFALMYNHKVFS